MQTQWYSLISWEVGLSYNGSFYVLIQMSLPYHIIKQLCINFTMCQFRLYMSKKYEIRKLKVS